MNLQGGIEKLNSKKLAVESMNKEYIIILDKDYSSFMEYINKRK